MCGNGGVISLEKQWAPTAQTYAYQMTVKDIAVHDSSFKQFKTLSEVFPKESECFMLGNPHYGAMGKVCRFSLSFGFGYETRQELIIARFFYNKFKLVSVVPALSLAAY